MSYLTPAGSVMRLFGRHRGQQAVAVTTAPPDLDVAASRTGERVFLHVANIRYDGAVEAALAVGGRSIAGGRVLEIAPANPRQAVTEDQPNVFMPAEWPLAPGPSVKWRFPAASVSVVEVDLIPH